MTTAQLLAACAESGVTVSVTQLTSWVRAGLIPEALHHRHGRGRGLGSEWRWEAECLPRALIIGRTLADEATTRVARRERGQRGQPARFPRGYDRAALMLATLGYAPDAERLRAMLVTGLYTFEQLLTRRQTYLTTDQPLENKRLALRDHVRRSINRTVAQPTESATHSIMRFSEALHGLADVEPAAGSAGNDSDSAHPGASLSLRAMRVQVQHADGRRLLENYRRAGDEAKSLAAQWEWFSTLLTAFVPDTPLVQTTDAGEATIFGLTREVAQYPFRLIVTVLLTVIPSDVLAAMERGQLTPLYMWLMDLLAPFVDQAGLSLSDLYSQVGLPQATDAQPLRIGGSGPQ
jgi:hypothetical protein